MFKVFLLGCSLYYYAIVVNISQHLHVICFVSLQTVAYFSKRINKYIGKRIYIRCCVKEEIAWAGALEMLRECYADEPTRKRIMQSF